MKIFISISKDRGRVRVWLSAPNMLSKLFVFFLFVSGGDPPRPPFLVLSKIATNFLVCCLSRHVSRSVTCRSALRAKLQTFHLN